MDVEERDRERWQMVMTLMELAFGKDRKTGFLILFPPCHAFVNYIAHEFQFLTQYKHVCTRNVVGGLSSW